MPISISTTPVMSPRKAILRELSQQNDPNGAADASLRPASIPGFEARPDQFQKAVNDLLRSRLVEGHTDEEGRMTISINTARARDVRRELRPIWARPALWAAVIVLLAAFGATLAI